MPPPPPSNGRSVIASRVRSRGTLVAACAVVAAASMTFAWRPGTGLLRSATADETPSVTRPPRSAVLSDGEAAARVTPSDHEPRPANHVPNRTVPSRRELAAFRRLAEAQGVGRHVTGRFAGTTDELIQWAAHKWGIDADLLRAQAMAESAWSQSKVGDRGRSFGLMQIKRTIWRGSYPLSRRSTAFNVDLSAAIVRQAYDGRANWLRRHGYRGGDIWGSLGYYYSGGWYDAGARRYIATVRRHLAERTWTRLGS